MQLRVHLTVDALAGVSNLIVSFRLRKEQQSKLSKLDNSVLTTETLEASIFSVHRLCTDVQRCNSKLNWYSSRVVPVLFIEGNFFV